MHDQFQSCDKDGSYTNQFAISENPMLHANFMALCFTETELLPTEALHCRNRDYFTIFAPVTLALTQ